MVIKLFRKLFLGVLIGCMLLSGTAFGNESFSIPKEEQEKISKDSLGEIIILFENDTKKVLKNDRKIVCIQVGDLIEGKLYSLYPDVKVDFNQIPSGNDLNKAAKLFQNHIKYKNGGRKEYRNTSPEETRIIFSQLPIGVYLIYEEDEKNESTMEPTLVTIPTWKEGEEKFCYTVEVNPKYGRKIEVIKKEAPATGTKNHAVGYFLKGVVCILLSIFLLGNLYLYQKDKTR